MRKNKQKFILLLLGSAAALAGLFVLAVLSGRDGIGIPADGILQMRILRISCGLIAGIALAAAGCAYQTVLANPLADPYLLGSSSGAACGIALLSFFGISRSGLIYPVAAGLASCLAVWAVLKIAGNSFSKKNIILSGVAVNLFLSAIVLLLISIRRKEIFSVFYFMMGDLSETRLSLIAASAAVVAAITVFLLTKARFLNALSMGEDLSGQLGIDHRRETRNILIASSLLTGAAVSISGTIGFIGLMAPHIARKLIGSDSRFMLPVAAITGAGLLIISDFAAKYIMYPLELPVGVITALLGAPFFLWIYKR